MDLQKNESFIDRGIRVVAGVVFFLVGYYYFSGWVAVVLYVLGTIALCTAATGFCALYKLLGISTLKKPVAPTAPPKPVEPPKPPDSAAPPQV